MDSHPYHRNQMPFPQYYHPGYEPIHPQMKMDPSKPPVFYEQSWPPYMAGYSYPSPVHFCCGHNSFPGYCGPRPYPHVPSPSPMHYPGHCPAYLDPYTVPCTPPPHYTMEIPRYEYDKCMPKEYPYHCCGCPNHTCHQKEGNKTVKIEEQEPEVEKKVNDALVPAESRNYRYPFVWIPPEYMKKREQVKPVAAEMGGQDEVARDAKHPEYSKAGGQEEPRVWNGWFPFDMKSPPNMILDSDGRINQNLQNENNRKEFEDGKRTQNQKSENETAGFPFPIIWVPYCDKQEEDGRKNNQETPSSTSTPKSIEEAPQNHVYKSFPVNFIAGEKAASGTSSEEPTNTDGFNVTEKVNKEKGIPVKQMKLHQGKDDSESSTRRGRNIPVKQIEENMAEADKEFKTDVKRESTSPRKTSKLPPVCLRVDSFPRKSNGNGSSRSPSPPASKEHSRTTNGGTSKNSSSSTMSEKAQPDLKQNASNASETPKNSFSSTTSEQAQPHSKLQNASSASEDVRPKEKVIEVVEKKTSGNKDESQLGGHESSFGTPMRKESYTDGDECKTKENKAGSKEELVVEEKATEGRGASDSNKTVDQCKTKRKVLSDVEAAVLIQAAYRGFQVRKWEPLKKLKPISEVSKQVTEVREHIRALEASSDLQNDEKQRLTIGETIMRLLLKLDTIQGLHPSVREIRKSMARKLTSLQEKLDHIMSKKFEQQMQGLSATKPVEDVEWSWQDGKHRHEQQEEQIAASGEDSKRTYQENQDPLKTCQDKISVEDSISYIKPEEDLPFDGSKESWPPVSPIYNNSKAEPVARQNEMTNGGGVQVDAVGECDSENGLTETENMIVENNPKPEVKGTPVGADDSIVTSLKELPQGVIDEEPVKLDSENNIGAELGRFMPQQTGGVAMVMDDNSAQHVVVSEIDAIKELPVGILDEDPMMAQSQHEKTSEIDAIKELPGGIPDENAMTAHSDRDGKTGPEPSNVALRELPVGLFVEEQESSGHEICEKTETSKEAIRELPVGLLDEDMASSEFNEAEQTETSKEAMAELPVGLLDEDMTKSEQQEHEETMTSLEIQVAREEEHEGTAQMNASADSTSTKVQSEQQQQQHMLPDDQAEVQSSETEESDAWVRVKSQKEQHDASSEDTEVECHLGEGFRCDDEHPPYQSVPSVSEVPENGNMTAELVIGADAKDRETMAKKKDEQHDVGLNNDKKLIEENKKLREMMKKLLDAGNEQLNVISNLTGRVKDLEEKLARKKKQRPRGFRPGTTRRPCKKSLNNPLKGKTVGVTM